MNWLLRPLSHNICWLSHCMSLCEWYLKKDRTVPLKCSQVFEINVYWFLVGIYSGHTKMLIGSAYKSYLGLSVKEIHYFSCIHSPK